MSNKFKFYTIIFSALLSSVLFFCMYTYNIDLKSANIFTNYHVTPLSEIKQNNSSDRNENLNLKEVDKNKIGEDMLIVNLQEMKISTVKSGEMTKTFDIVSKGKPGSYYETPAGNYEVRGKFGNKFSNLGAVYMPYSMQFYGNFFIHGIPYHTDGTRVATSYSGGCIRLADNDAKEIYEFAKVSTRVLILNSNISNNTYTNQNNIKSFDQEKTKNILTVLTALEILNQEKYITFNNKKVQIKDLNKYILENNLEAKNTVLNQIGVNNFKDKELEKLTAIGIYDSNFTTESDRESLINYVQNNKSYILTLLN